MDKEIAEKETAEKLKSLTQQAEEYKVRSFTHSDQLHGYFKHLCTMQSLEPSTTGGYPGQTGGFHLIFTRFRYPGSRGMYLFSRLRDTMRGLSGGLHWRGFHSWFVISLMFKGQGSSV